MRIMNGIEKGLFDHVLFGSEEKELLELIKLDDNELYRRIGIAGRESISSLRPGRDYLKSPNLGDVEAKSPFFFRSEKVETPTLAVYLDLPADNLEAGRMLSGQIGGHFDRVICETASASSLYGYKQEAVKLGNRCVAAIRARYPMLDERIVMAYVALRTKELFSVCSMW